MTYYKLENTFRKWICLDTEPDFVLVVTATFIANRLKTLPVWIMVTGKPSAGKSLVVGSFDTCEQSYPVSKLSSKSMASGISLKSKEMQGEKEPSLLEYLDGKVMTVRDASTILSINKNERNEIFSILRTAYDGQVELRTGLTQKDFTAKFGVIINATPDIERKNTYQSALGERFLTIRPKDQELTPDMWIRILNTDETQMHAELKEACNKFMSTCSYPETVETDIKILDYAQILATLRTHISRDGMDRDAPTWAGESPIRVSKQLSALYTALKHLTNKQRALQVIKRVTKDSVPLERMRIMEYVYSGYNTRSLIHKRCGISQRVVARSVDDLLWLRGFGYGPVLEERDGGDDREKVLNVRAPYRQLLTITGR